MADLEFDLSKKLAGIIYCNPFTTDRDDLENLLLKEASEYPRDPKWEHIENQNLRKILTWADGLVETWKKTLHKESKLANSRIDLYKDLVYIIIYHELIEEFDSAIDTAHRSGSLASMKTIYKQFCKRIEYFTQLNEKITVSIYRSHIFACLFQIRRAYYHIHKELIGNSPAIQTLRASAWESIFTHDMKRYQESLFHRMSEIMTLITGPSGSGKELVARAIGLSQFIPYNEKTGQFEQDFLNSFHPINLAALSPTLIESELFGHKKGAFTGANEDRKGYLESCGTYGTVFLDEIGETPLEIQVKLLRALQSREFQRLGESTITKFKGKLIAATNRNLIEEVAAGHFREDFYYRLCADRIQTANLKEMISGNRKELLDLLIHIAKKVAGEENKDSLSKECLTWIEKKIPHQYDWPGNIRELEQCVRNILIRGSYYPEIKPSPVSETNKTILQKFEKCELTLKELNQAYTQHAYSLYKSYEEVGRRLEADRRTIKKYTE